MKRPRSSPPAKGIVIMAVTFVVGLVVLAWATEPKQ